MSTVYPTSLHKFHTAVHSWYQAHGRKDLPWRTTSDPYAVYVSEIMLQQTQVATVLARYYSPFLRRFPTLKALADAPRDEVLKAWQGLGYYNRAANLHAAAQQSGGRLPDTVDALMGLPGIGRNTAHAVAALAFRKPVAVMEANVRRVLARIFALAAPSESELWEHAHALLGDADPFEYNQAMMDIGAMVCRPRAPLCKVCPASIICKGQTSPESYPAPKAKKAVPVRKKTIVVLCNKRGDYFAQPRTGKFLTGLYHFLESEPASADMQLLGGIRQQYSHFTLEAEVFLKKSTASGKGWYSLSALKRLPMSMAEQKILALLQARIPAKKRA